MHMWGVDSALEGWFAAVKQRREEKYGGGAEKLEEVPQTGNLLTKELLGE
jgi:hypothetical protein